MYDRPWRRVRRDALDWSSGPAGAGPTTIAMERLWSPWRLAYVTSNSSKPDGCVFCAVSSPGAGALGDPERDELVLVHGHTCYVILNLYPYNNGHLMVVPRRHIASLTLATREELDEMMQFTRDAEAALIADGVSVDELMQRAGRGAAEWVWRMSGGRIKPSVWR